MFRSPEHEKYLETNELQCRDFHARIQNFEIARDELDHRTKEIHETLLDQQTRSPIRSVENL
jgi:hypothetical protein